MRRLTVLLPLKGRHLYTLRFLWHANRQKLPFHFLIADGQVHPELSSLLQNAQVLFPNLDIEYVPYPEDTSFARYFSKMAEALGRVRTPYARIADNDDFLMPAGIARSVAFLEGNPDYVCCGGGVAGFSVEPGPDDPYGGLSGSLGGLSYRYSHYDRSVSFSSGDVVERLRQGSRYWWPYYAVYRTDSLHRLWAEARDIDFSDLQLHELFFVMRTLTLGKAHADGQSISYLRQYNTPRLTPAFTKDWVHHLFRSRFTGDFAAMVETIAAAAAKADGVAKEAVAEMLRGICEQWLREFLRINYGEVQTLKQMLRDRAPAVALWLKRLRRRVSGQRRAALLTQLRRDGASADYVQTFERELDAVEAVLGGRDFAEFLRPFVPILGDAECGAASVGLSHAAE